MLVLSDDYADTDSLGHSEYCDGLVEVIRSVDSEGSFTIGIYGQWGMGKTSILRQIQGALDGQENEDDKKIFTVWFNPWQFVAEEHLIIPFFHTLISHLENVNRQSTLEKVKDKVGKFLSKIAHIPTALLYGMEGEFKIPLLLKAKFVASKTMDDQSKAEDEINKMSSQKMETEFQDAAKKYESTYYRLIQILREAALELDFKIVIFIDDLDRCLPEKAVQLLEGLKVLLDLPNFVFVIGVAQEVIERGIRVRYRELYKADEKGDIPNIEEQYLDKIIQFPISLPSAEPGKLKENLLEKYLNELGPLAQFADLIYDSLGSNPRTLKRFINAISFSLYLARQRLGDDSDFHPELLIKVCLIGYLFPALYRQLERFPVHLVRLESIIWELENERNKKKEENEKEPIDEQKTEMNRAGLRIIDQWLEDDKLAKLLPILKKRKYQKKEDDSIEQNEKISEENEIGFNNEETVIKYIRLLAISLQSEVASKEKEHVATRERLTQEIKHRMVSIPEGDLKIEIQDGDPMIIRVRSFMMDKYPVTQSLYQSVMDENPSHFKGGDRPVENVSWIDAVKFCNKLSKKMNLDEVYILGEDQIDIAIGKNGYRLPTEVEWEYACQNNAQKADNLRLDQIAWYFDNSTETQEVGQKTPNDFGLYDMLGNVWEWCNDWYSKELIDLKDKPSGPETGTQRVIRGGSWLNSPKSTNSKVRRKHKPSFYDNNLGIRLVSSSPN